MHLGAGVPESQDSVHVGFFRSSICDYLSHSSIGT
jgi:hypothetical protein